MVKKKKHKLTFQLDFNFFLIGISSSENDYRLSWEMNKKLIISLRKGTDHVIKRKEIELLQIHGDLTDNQQQQIISSVKSIKGVIGVFKLDINTLKSKNKLIIE